MSKYAGVFVECRSDQHGNCNGVVCIEPVNHPQCEVTNYARTFICQCQCHVRTDADRVLRDARLALDPPRPVRERPQTGLDAIYADDKLWFDEHPFLPDRGRPIRTRLLSQAEAVMLKQQGRVPLDATHVYGSVRVSIDRLNCRQRDYNLVRWACIR